MAAAAFSREHAAAPNDRREAMTLSKIPRNENAGDHMIPGTHQYSLMERVVFGQRVAGVLPEEIRRSGSRRVFVISTASIADSAALQEIVASLGEALVGVFAGVRAHAPREC